jgi:Gp37 protein.
MASTNEIIDAVVKRLQVKLPWLAVEYFPEKAADYRLNHPRGALLVSYSGSRFEATRDAGFVSQPRGLRLTVTVLMRQLHGRGGAVDVVDGVRLALLGWRAPDCRKTHIASDKFLGEVAGIWQYAVDFTAQSVVVEDTEVDTEKPLTQVTYEESLE